MGVIKSLFDIERVAATLSDADKTDLCQRLAKPKLELFKEWLENAKLTELPKTKLGEAISYTHNPWPALLVYLDLPFVAISNNASERNIKRWFGAGVIGFSLAPKKVGTPQQHS